MPVKCLMVLPYVAQAAARIVARATARPVRRPLAGARRAAGVGSAAAAARKAAVVATAACVSVGVPSLLLSPTPATTSPGTARSDPAPLPAAPPGPFSLGPPTGTVPPGLPAAGPPGGAFPLGPISVTPLAGNFPSPAVVEDAGLADAAATSRRCAGEGGEGVTCRGAARPMPVDEPSSLALAATALALVLLLNAPGRRSGTARAAPRPLRRPDPPEAGPAC